MTATEKKHTEIRGSVMWTVIAVVSFVSYVWMPYWEGRSNSWWAIPPLLPADSLPLLLLLVACIALLNRCVRSLYFKRRSVATTGMCLIGLLLFYLCFLIRSADTFHRGFSDYARTVLTAEEWRGIARLAQEQLKPQGSISGPGKNLWNEADRALWTKFTAGTRIQKLDPRLMIFVSPKSTTIEWGGALTGHRAVIIFTHKNGQLPPNIFGAGTFIAGDIATYISAE